MQTLTHNGQPVATVRDTWQTPARGSNDTEYQIYLACAHDGKGGDITRNGEPLLSYDEWLEA